MPASAASRIESAAKRGGTKIIAVFAPVSATAAWNVLKTGMPSTSWPPLPGVTPDDDVRAVALLFSAWNVPSRPVMPETQSCVSLSTRTLMPLASSTTFSAASSIVVAVCTFGQVRLGQQLAALLVVGAVEAHDERHRRLDLRRTPRSGPRATSSQRVIPPKMLNSTALTFVVGEDHLDRLRDRLGLRAAAGVEEVRRRAAGLGDDVERATSRARRRCRGCRCRRRA